MFTVQLKNDPRLKQLSEAIIVKLYFCKTHIYKHRACAYYWLSKEIELNYNILFTFTFSLIYFCCGAGQLLCECEGNAGTM